MHARRLLLADPSWAVLLVVVLGTLFVGATRSLSFFVVQAQQHSVEAREANDVKIYMAVLLPVVGSAMLMVLFYFLDQLSLLLVGLFSFSSFVSVTYALSPLFCAIARRLRLAPEYQYALACLHTHAHTRTRTRTRTHARTRAHAHAHAHAANVGVVLVMQGAVVLVGAVPDLGADGDAGRARPRGGVARHAVLAPHRRYEQGAWHPRSLVLACVC
jgi:hypothetical protein